MLLKVSVDAFAKYVMSRRQLSSPPLLRLVALKLSSVLFEVRCAAPLMTPSCHNCLIPNAAQTSALFRGLSVSQINLLEPLLQISCEPPGDTLQ